jgi:asparagine synthase (glutamine-hydrolysing)
MCGIVAMLRFDGGSVEERNLRAMRDALTHRGPDDAGLYIDGAAGLAHRRLSILDLSRHGHQPMTNEDGTLWLVFNGEIYNYRELTARLIRSGHHFHSNTDSETILHLYEELGERCVEELHGMFAFVLWDSRKRKLFGARDRIGIKPLHYHVSGRQFVCASEVKALVPAGTGTTIDPAGLVDSLYCGSPQADRTPFADVRMLRPGHTISVDAHGVRIRKYWDLRYNYDYTRNDRQLVSQLSELLDDAVRVHCISDAPLGCHLSGGLDSSTVASLAARHRAPLKTFSIRFGAGDQYDESLYARMVARHAGTEYVEASPDSALFWDVLPSLIWHLELPSASGTPFAYFTSSRLAAQHVKVSLTGHGGDEVFAGYLAQFQATFGSTASEWTQIPPVIQHPSRLTRLRRLIRREGVRGTLRHIVRRFTPQPESLENTWVALHCGSLPAHNPLYSRRFVKNLGGYDPREDYLAELRAAPTTETLDRCLYHDLRSYLPGLLYAEDRMSMAVSLESRVPLLDHRIAELMATVPPEQKVRGMEPKAMLRAAAQSILPAAVASRKTKSPFAFPMVEWTRRDLMRLFGDVLRSAQTLDRGVLDPDHIRRDELTINQLWTALNLELWCRIFIDRDPVWCAATGTARAHARHRTMIPATNHGS